MGRLGGAALAAVAWLCAIGPACAAPALWMVRDGDSEIYLFGTLHALTPGLSWRTPAYDAAYARSDTVWFEAELDAAPAEIAGLVDRYGVDRERPLSAKLPEPARRALRRQTDLARIEHLRPWAAALMLSMQPVSRRGATVEGGADMTMTRATRAGDKTLRAFETLEDQAKMFASLPETAQVRYLADVVAERSPRLRLTPLRRRATLEQAWLAGDVERLAPDVGDLRRHNPALYEALLRRRNLVWADRLGEVMAGSGVALVNVGALHMLGSDGLPAVLQARGFDVQRVQ